MEKTTATIDVLSHLNVLDEVLLDVLLELWRHEGLLGAGPHLGVSDEEGQHLGHVRHQPLQQGQRHRQEQRPGANLGHRYKSVDNVDIPIKRVQLSTDTSSCQAVRQLSHPTTICLRIAAALSYNSTQVLPCLCLFPLVETKTEKRNDIDNDVSISECRNSP